MKLMLPALIRRFCSNANHAGMNWETDSDNSPWAYAIGPKGMSHVFSMKVIESPDNYGQVASGFTTSMYTLNTEEYQCETCHGTGNIDEGEAHGWECSSCYGTGLSEEARGYKD